MVLYDGIKDVAKIVQKADNIDLYLKLLDLGEQALELQNENSKLKEEIASLKKTRITADKIQRHKNPYVTLSDDPMELQYCAVCWDSDQKLVQMKIVEQYGYKNVHCHRCRSTCHLDTRE